MNYYNPSKILLMTDLDGEIPSIYIITSNRSAGKTTAFLKKSLELFQENGKKTILLYRFSYELVACADIYKDVLFLYNEYGKEMSAKSRANGLFYEMFLDGESFGFALSLNNPDTIKKYSPLFADVDLVIFDEYQTESGKYLKNEIQKMESILISVMRGGGSQSRYVQVILLGNNVTLMNPYFIKFGIYNRLRFDTKFMRGKGWVAEFHFNKSASTAIKENPFAKAFENDSYIDYSSQNCYLVDSECFIDKPKGKNKYLFTISHDGELYGVRDFYEEGYIYISKKSDMTCKTVVTFKANNHTQNTIMLNHYSYIWQNIRDSYNGGFLRFDNIKTKSAIFDILAIDLYN